MNKKNILNLEKNDKIQENQYTDLEFIERNILNLEKNDKIQEHQYTDLEFIERNILNLKKNDNKYNNIKLNIIEYFNKKFLNKSIKNIKIFIFGDSHCKCFIRDSIKINNILIENRFLSSVSIIGLSNYNSTLNYKKILDDHIFNNCNDYYVFKFGQVDVEYIYFYKTLVKKQKLNKIDFYTDIISNYINVLKKFQIKLKNKISVCGINLVNPIKWDSILKQIIKIDNIPNTITYDSKNKDNMNFNNILKNKCENNNIIYFDTTNKCSYEEKSLFNLKDKFIGKDNHYKGSEAPRTFETGMTETLNYGYNTFTVFLEALIDNINIHFNEKQDE